MANDCKRSVVTMFCLSTPLALRHSELESHYRYFGGGRLPPFPSKEPERPPSCALKRGFIADLEIGPYSKSHNSHNMVYCCMERRQHVM